MFTMKHLAEVLLVAVVAAWWLGSDYLEYQRELECVDRGGQWVTRDGCENDRCVGAKPK